MIFVNEKGVLRQLELLAFLLVENEYELVAWMYPESKYSHLKGIDLTLSKNVDAEPVTQYEGDVHVKCTDRILASESLINLFRRERKSIFRHCGSICLYDVGSYEWSIAAIGHEGMVLVRDESMLSKINGAGFNASLNKPDWW